MLSSFAPLQYRDAKKRIINKLTSVDAYATAAHLIATLHASEPRDLRQIQQRPPWRVLLLLKWVLEHGRFERTDLAPPSKFFVDKLISDVGNLETKMVLPSQHQDFHVFLRKLAYQQFWFQETPQIAHFARQALLFRQLPKTHPLSSKFREITGQNLDDFLALLFGIATTAIARKVPLTRAFFSPLDRYFTSAAVDATLDILSRDRIAVREYLTAARVPDKFAHYEYYERTPLSRFPLLRDGDRFMSYSPIVFVRGVETIVYDILRQDDASGFMNAFGPLFEDYVRRGVQELEIDFIDEKQLQRTYKGSKAVDFAWLSDAGAVFVDAKGVELPLGAMVTNDTDFLSAQLRNSVMKALEQSASLAARMKLTTPPYVLVVTYKHFLLGNGSDLLRYTDTAAFGELRSTLDMDRVHFVSIEEFDYLVAGLRAHRMHPAEFLARTHESDRDRKTKKFLMMQHINKILQPSGTPEYLIREKNELLSVLEEALPNG